MTVIAGVGTPKSHAQIRSRNSKTVIMAKIDFHIIAAGHMTTDTLCTFGFYLMKMMTGIIVFWLMALHTQPIVLHAQVKFQSMRIMAIHALNAFFIHFTL